MKKLLLTIALALVCGATMAQKVVTSINTEKSYALRCKATDHNGFIGVDDDGKINGRSATANYIITFEAANTENGYYIKVGEKYLNHNGLNISAKTEKGTVWTLGVGGKDKVAGYVTFTIGNDKYLNNNGSDCNDGTCINLKANTHAGGPGSGNACSLWQMCEYVEGYKIINDPADFVNGEVYTFITSRGWMGAKDGNNNVISTVYTANGITASDALAEEANFQWTVYKSENNNYYLYNIGKKMFMGIQSANNTAVPFAATPQSKKLTFKKSSSTAYPIMFSTDNAGVVNHSGNHASGLITWTGGWTNLADDGSNHKIEKVATLDDATLAGIAELVKAYELDNTDAVAALRAAISKAETLFGQITIGTKVGEYTATDADYMTKFNAIIAFLNAIESTNNPTPAEVDAKTAEVNAIIASFQINVPESGNYYRISYNFNGTVNYIQGQASNVSGKLNGMLMTADKGAASVFYFADSKLISYTAGKYVNDSQNTRGLQETAGAVSFEAGSTVGTIAVKAPYYLHANTANGVNFVDKCSGSGNPAHAQHNFIIEEVETLPVSISAAGKATFFAPVAVTIPEDVKAYTVTINGEWATLNEIEGGVIPANTGVVLEGAEGSHDFVITTTEATATSDLRGSIATTYYTEAGTYYALGIVDGVVAFYKDAFNNSRFQNNSHKAYLYVAGTNNTASYSFRYGEGTTGVEEVKTEPTVDASQNGEVKVIYDLTGRRVEAITAPGIYIVGGKKVLVK